MSLYYFAFGSNMDIQQMEYRKKKFEEKNKEIKVEFTGRQKGAIKDWKLIFNKINTKKEGSGYGNIEREIGSIVEGIIYKVNDDAIKMLDWYEGVRYDSYRQMEMLVENEKNESTNCIVYIANPKKTDNSRKPTKEYLNHFLEGKEYLSESYFLALKNTKTIDIKLHELATIRNPSAHSNILPEMIEKKIQVYYDDIIRLIEDYQRKYKED